MFLLEVFSRRCLGALGGKGVLGGTDILHSEAEAVQQPRGRGCAAAKSQEPRRRLLLLLLCARWGGLLWMRVYVRE